MDLDINLNIWTSGFAELQKISKRQAGFGSSRLNKKKDFTDEELNLLLAEAVETSSWSKSSEKVCCIVSPEKPKGCGSSAKKSMLLPKPIDNHDWKTAAGILPHATS